jgi:mycofactocin precursor
MMTHETPDPAVAGGDLAPDESPLSAEALIEEISIDGMCGVY